MVATPDPAYPFCHYAIERRTAGHGHSFRLLLTCYNKTPYLFRESLPCRKSINMVKPLTISCPTGKGRALTSTPLTGQYCRLEPLDASLHAADLFDAYALGDDSDWTWLSSTQPVSVEETARWVLDKVMDDELVPYAVIDLRTARCGAGELSDH